MTDSISELMDIDRNFLIPFRDLTPDRVAQPQLRIVAGVQAAALVCPSLNYAKGACVPNDREHAISFAEYDALCTSPAHLGPQRPFFGLFEIPTDQKQRLMENGLRPDYVERLSVPASEPEYLKPFRDFVQSRFPAVQEPKIHGVALDAPGLVTVSIDTQAHEFVGLHIDSWDMLPFWQRSKSIPRISLNLGPEERALVIVPITINRMAEMMGHSSSEQWVDSRQLVREFWHRHPNFPLLRLKLFPGQAYIVWADLFVHDGSSRDAKKPSCNYVIRGEFQFPQVAA